MLPPYELKNKKKFSMVLRGYAQTEVDEHIEYLIEKYTELYRKNDELERQIRLLSSRLDELETKENAINKAIVGAQKLKDKIIAEAEAEADLITSTARKSTAKILSSFENKIYHEKATLHAMMEQVGQFKAQMLEEYEKHIQLLNMISPEQADPEYEKQDGEYVAMIMSDIRRAASESVQRTVPAEEQGIISEAIGEFALVSQDEAADKSEQRVKRPMRAKRAPGLSSKLAKVIKEETQKDETPEDDTDDRDDSLKELFGEN